MTQKEGWGPQPSAPIAISYPDYSGFGCPVCLTGEKRAHILTQKGNSAVLCCAACDIAYIVCMDETAQPDIEPAGVFLTVTRHPLAGEQYATA